MIMLSEELNVQGYWNFGKDPAVNYSNKDIDSLTLNLANRFNFNPQLRRGTKDTGKLKDEYYSVGYGDIIDLILEFKSMLTLSS